MFNFSENDKAKLTRASVSALVLFGSRAQGLNKDSSDYDIAVLLSDNSLLKNSNKRQEIYDTVYDLISSQVKKLVNIDIVFLETASGELKAHVMRHGQVIFEADESAFPNFKERTILEYSDFAPVRQIFHEAIISRIK